MNAHLKPQPVAVLKRKPWDSFEARFSATSRHYVYRILNRRAPLARDARRVSARDAARGALGHARRGAGLDRQPRFLSTFRAAECQANSPLRTLEKLDVVARNGGMIEVFAPGAFVPASPGARDHRLRSNMSARAMDQARFERRAGSEESRLLRHGRPAERALSARRLLIRRNSSPARAHRSPAASRHRRPTCAHRLACMVWPTRPNSHHLRSRCAMKPRIRRAAGGRTGAAGVRSRPRLPRHQLRRTVQAGVTKPSAFVGVKSSVTRACCRAFPSAPADSARQGVEAARDR